MYDYILFVLIGILFFLLFNYKNKFSIGFQDGSESGEDVEQQNTVPQITAALNTNMLTSQQIDDKR